MTPGPTGERQEHPDAIISFAGFGQRSRLFGDTTSSELSGQSDVPEDLPIALQHAVHVLKDCQGPNHEVVR